MSALNTIRRVCRPSACSEAARKSEYGEYGTGSGGLLGFDRRTQHIEKFDAPDVAQSIARVGEHVVIATEFGPAVLDSRRVRRFLVDETSDVRLRTMNQRSEF